MDRAVFQTTSTDDGIAMTIVTEWSKDETIRVTILSEGTIPLSGQTTMEHQLREFAQQNVSREKRVLDIKKELSGKEKDVRFVLRGSKLMWKKGAWWKGGLDVEPVKDIIAYADMSLRWLNDRAVLCSNDDCFVVENENLAKRCAQLTEHLRTIETTKNRLEDSLYAKFLAVLNEKKKKIRELEERLKDSDPKISGDVYDEDTDEGDDDRSLSGSSDTVDRNVSREEDKLLDSRTNRPSSSSQVRSPNGLAESSAESEQDDMFVLRYEETQENMNAEEEDDEDDMFS